MVALIGSRMAFLPQRHLAQTTLTMMRYRQGSFVSGGDVPMKKLICVTVALGLAFAFTAPAFSADVAKAKTEADCTKAGGVWDAQAKKCKPKM
ncbi:MAG TPA: hypothetical protein VKC99_08930 [Methyloceanibacter sp.]|nr:hypothetical protein [Methyloceanibacter sp.]